MYFNQLCEKKSAYIEPIKVENEKNSEKDVEHQVQFGAHQIGRMGTCDCGSINDL